ncbi:hypothetical protein [Jidongwangia harbinensis]|uniref:hypothetical protein n=1 Tax=Jidongwangia harbinensis TaxID=2878561 RepID=UPI001CDA2842|nr:hypothetical protein [Jidongwangia harbinensis]MCA2217471.1 hypothetical protein [Jidongwangia harbinensis]
MDLRALTRTWGLAVAVVALAALTACGGEPETDDNVATIAGNGPSAAAPAKEGAGTAPAGGGERPLIRVDTSEQEVSRLRKVWGECLKANGAEFVSNADGSVKGIEDRTSPKQNKALAACVAKEPETVVDRAERTDPLFKDKIRDQVTCMKSHKIDVDLDPEGDGFSFPDGLPPDNVYKFVDECEVKVFGNGD